jgi:hypothetical protein
MDSEAKTARTGGFHRETLWRRQSIAPSSVCPTKKDVTRRFAGRVSSGRAAMSTALSMTHGQRITGNDSPFPLRGFPDLESLELVAKSAGSTIIVRGGAVTFQRSLLLV